MNDEEKSGIRFFSVPIAVGFLLLGVGMMGIIPKFEAIFADLVGDPSQMPGVTQFLLSSPTLVWFLIGGILAAATILKDKTRMPSTPLNVILLLLLAAMIVGFVIGLWLPLMATIHSLSQ